MLFTPLTTGEGQGERLLSPINVNIPHPNKLFHNLIHPIIRNRQRERVIEIKIQKTLTKPHLL